MLFSALPFAASAASNMPIKVGDTKTIVIEEKGGYLLFDFTPEETGTYVFWSSDNESKAGKGIAPNRNEFDSCHLNRRRSILI